MSTKATPPIKGASPLSCTSRTCGSQSLLFSVGLGAQVATWSSLIPYMKQYTTASERTAAHYLAATLVVLSVGRFATTPRDEVHPSKHDSWGSTGVANALLLLLAVVRPGMLGAYAIVGSSFFLSIMFPTIFASGPQGSGPEYQTRRFISRDGHRRRGPSFRRFSASSPRQPAASLSDIWFPRLDVLASRALRLHDFEDTN